MMALCLITPVVPPFAGGIQVALTTTVPFPIKVIAAPGTGKRMLLNCLAGEAVDATHTAISWAAINAPLLVRLIKGNRGVPKSLFTCNKEDLKIMSNQVDIEVDGPSVGLCVACAVVSWLTGFDLIIERLAITGALDLRGRVLMVGGIGEKTTGAASRRVEAVILPEGNYKQLVTTDFHEIPVDLRDYARSAFHGAGTVVEVFEHIIPGELSNKGSWDPGDVLFADEMTPLLSMAPQGSKDDWRRMSHCRGWLLVSMVLMLG